MREAEHLFQQPLRAGQEFTTRYQRGHIEEARAGPTFADQIAAVLLGLQHSLGLG